MRKGETMDENIMILIVTIIFKLCIVSAILWGIAVFLRFVLQIEPKQKTKRADSGICSGRCAVCNLKLTRRNMGRRLDDIIVCDNCFRLQDRVIGL